MKRESSKGTIIVNVDQPSYAQWIEKFVATVLEKSGVSYNEVIIGYIEFSKRIYLTVDGTKYVIRTWDFSVIETDENNVPCAEEVEYTLYQEMEDEDGRYSQGIFEGSEKIEWTN